LYAYSLDSLQIFRDWSEKQLSAITTGCFWYYQNK